MIHGPNPLHYQVTVPGFEQLTTQLYFEGDPNFDTDPFWDSSRIIPLDKSVAAWKGVFDIVLDSA